MALAGDECAPAASSPAAAPTATVRAKPHRSPTLAVGFDDGSIEAHVASNLDAFVARRARVRPSRAAVRAASPASGRRLRSRRAPTTTPCTSTPFAMRYTK